jgi:hypothetical protein
LIVKKKTLLKYDHYKYLDSDMVGFHAINKTTNQVGGAQNPSSLSMHQHMLWEVKV